MEIIVQIFVQKSYNSAKIQI